MKFFWGLVTVIFIGASLWYLYQKPALINGEMAPEITGTLRNGDSFKLSSLKGRYVLLHFWGSWCGPCRKENPELVGLFEKYHGKQFKDGAGFEIVSIALENDMDAANKAISADRMDTWGFHLIDTNRMHAKPAEWYGVKSIPSTFLIDPGGMIIGVNLSPEELGKILESR